MNTDGRSKGETNATGAEPKPRTVVPYKPRRNGGCGWSGWLVVAWTGWNATPESTGQMTKKILVSLWNPRGS